MKINKAEYCKVKHTYCIYVGINGQCLHDEPYEGEGLCAYQIELEAR